MADQIPDLNATARSGTGKGAARKARREGLVPGCGLWWWTRPSSN